MESLLSGIARQEKLEMLSWSAVSGGDINDAYLLNTTEQSYFVKANALPQAGKMLKAEWQGLQALRAAGAATPRLIALGQFQAHAYLILGYEAQTRPDTAFWTEFGQRLAELHKQHSSQYGWTSDNFIGSLPQFNSVHDSWVDFYREQRLKPQVKIGRELGMITGSEAKLFERFYEQLPSLLPEEVPSLLHGDLWSGNFICSEARGPYSSILPYTTDIVRQTSP